MQNIVLYLIDLGAEWMRSLLSIKTTVIDHFIYVSYDAHIKMMSAVTSLSYIITHNFVFAFVSFAMCLVRQCITFASTTFASKCNDLHRESVIAEQSRDICDYASNFNDIHEMIWIQFNINQSSFVNSMCQNLILNSWLNFKMTNYTNSHSECV